MDTLEETYRVAFEDNLRIDAGQNSSRLTQCVDAEFNYSEKGDRFTFDYVDNDAEPEEMVDRFGDLPERDIGERRRVGYFKAHDDGRRLGASYDVARQVADPTNKKVVSMKRGLARHHDARILEAIVGSAYEGRNGTTAKALPATQKIAVDSHKYKTGGSGNAPLSVSKVYEAKVMFDQAEHEGERWMIAESDQIARLLQDDKLASADYNTVKALVRGEIDEWAGFKWQRYEKLGLYSGGTHRRAVAVVKETVQYRSRVLHAPDVWLRKDKRPHYYGYYAIDTAGCRGEDTGVIEIACAAIT
jgi:hypothetical protein